MIQTAIGTSIAEAVISIALALFVVAYVVPPALVALANSTLTGVDPAVQTLLQVVLAIMAILAIVWHFFKAATSA